MQTFDFETTQQAEHEIGSMFDLETLEGRRQFHDLMRQARIRERDTDSRE